MSSVYQSIMIGLNEAVNDAKTDKNKLRRQTFVVTPVKVYSPENIKEIRFVTKTSENSDPVLL